MGLVADKSYYVYGEQGYERSLGRIAVSKASEGAGVDVRIAPSTPGPGDPLRINLNREHAAESVGKIVQLLLAAH